MKATADQVAEQARALAAHAEGLAEAVYADQSAHARALLILDQAKTLVAWTEED